MTRLLHTLLIVAVVIGASAWMPHGTPSSTQTIAGISPSTGSCFNGATNVCASMSVTMSPASPAFSGTLAMVASGGSCSGIDSSYATDFSLSSSTLAILNTSIAAGSYNVCVRASQTGLTSAYQQVAITVSAAGSNPTAGLIPNSSCTPTISGSSCNSDGYLNWSTAGLNAIPFTGHTSTTTLTVSTSYSGALGPGQVIAGTSIPAGTTISSMGTGTGNTGTYTISCPGGCPSSVSSEAMTAGGIPARTVVSNPGGLSPSGGDDTSAIQSAVNACGAGQVVQLNAGVFHISVSNITVNNSSCTIRGAGPGQQLSTGLNNVFGDSTNSGVTYRSCTSGTKVWYGDGSFCTDATATQIVQTDRQTNGYLIFNVYSPGNNVWSTVYNLSTDAVMGSYSVTLTATPSVSPGDFMFLDELTTSDPGVWWSPNFGSTHNNIGYGARRINSSLADVMEVASVSGNTVTFTTPVTYPYHTAYTAQLAKYPNSYQHGLGIENLMVWGASNGAINISGCAYCWVKNVEMAWQRGCGVCIAGGFRDEVRDSFIHEGDDPVPGGAGYLMAILGGSAEVLVENNQMWYGDKVDVMQNAGGGNVLAYNYMMDAFGATYPDSPEAGVNAGHMTTPHLELIEGNYSHDFKGDSFWGGSITVTSFRNWFKGLRDSSPPNTGYGPLNTYTNINGSCTEYYGDYVAIARAAVDVQTGSYYNNFVGNVIGSSGQTLLGARGCDSTAQAGWVVQDTTTAQDNAALAANDVPEWRIGYEQISTPTFVDSTIDTITRVANWDWASGSGSGARTCYDYGAATSHTCSGVETTLPNSFYLSSAPSFFGTHPWPWVDPTTGNTSSGSGSTQYLLPAMYCFGQGKMPTCTLP